MNIHVPTTKLKIIDFQCYGDYSYPPLIIYILSTPFVLTPTLPCI